MTFAELVNTLPDAELMAIVRKIPGQNLDALHKDCLNDSAKMRAKMIEIIIEERRNAPAPMLFL